MDPVLTIQAAAAGKFGVLRAFRPHRHCAAGRDRRRFHDCCRDCRRRSGRLDGPSAVPDGYWRRAACTAVAASLIARVVGAQQPEAFCAGLLADFGGALLHQADPAAHTEAMELAMAGTTDLVEAERTRFGWAMTNSPRTC